MNSKNKPPSARPSRYSNVKAKVNSGYNRRKEEEIYSSNKVNALYKRPELFQRLSPSFLARLEVEGATTSDYLLLDVRDEEAFSFCHIRDAYNYPARMLSRAVNCFTKEILCYMNKANKKILVYDADERIAVAAANMMFEKGVDNIYMLSGGIQKFVELYPHMVLGTFVPGHGEAAGGIGISNSQTHGPLTITQNTLSTASLASSRSSVFTTSLAASRPPSRSMSFK